MVVPNLTFIYDRKGQATKTKAGVVELRISAGKVRKYISTGVRLLPKEWKNGSVMCREDWVEVNRQLQGLYKLCSEIISQMVEDGEVDINAIPSALKGRLQVRQTFLQYAKECAKVKLNSLAPGTQRRYKVVFDFLESWKGLTYFSDITEANIRKMDDVLLARGLKEASRYNYHKVVKCFVARAFNEGLIKTNPYATLKIKRGDDTGLLRCLTPAEFHKFEGCAINVKHLERVRDLFVFQTYTMMSYSDLVEFDYRSCVRIAGEVVYRSRRIKTEQPFVVVLLPQAMAILKKYGYTLPIISNVKYNDYLKVAVTYAGIDKPVSTHWARHTGATLLINDGIPMHIVQHILGHASIRETEKTYARVLDDTIVRSMAKYRK